MYVYLEIDFLPVASCFSGLAMYPMKLFQVSKCVSVCMYVCMIIMSPYRLRHWLRLNERERVCVCDEAIPG